MLKTVHASEESVEMRGAVRVIEKDQEVIRVTERSFKKCPRRRATRLKIGI
jgi:hypothetical protein